MNDDTPEAIRKAGRVRLNPLPEQSLLSKASWMRAVDAGVDMSGHPDVQLHDAALYHPIEHYHRGHERVHGKLFVATTDYTSVVIGFMHKGLAWTHADFRGRGIGSLLYTKLMDHYGGIDAFYARFYGEEATRFTDAGLAMARRAYR